MATLKKTTKKAVSKAPGAPRKSAAAKTADAKSAKKQRKSFTEKRLRALLQTMLEQFSQQVAEGGNSYTNGDGFKLMQMMESLGLTKPSDVKVEWVEPKES